MAAELKVGIGVDATGLDTGLGKAETQLKGFGKSVATETKKVGASFQGMSRVLQDAAFGPGAIANNLSALGDDFKQLSQTAKESGQSIGKTLVQSLTGAGGLNLALGGLTLGLSLASFGLSAWERAFGSANKEVKKGTDELKEYVDNLDAVTQAQLKGTQSAQTELANLNILFHAYQNANLPLKTRKEAYSQLQEQYPSYFGNLKFEKEASDKTTASYNSLTQSILATARARAASELIAQKGKEKLVLELKYNESLEKQASLQNQINALTAKWNKTHEDAVEIIELQGKLGEERNNEINISNALAVQYNKLSIDQLKLEKFINGELEKGGKLIDDNKDKSAEATEARIKDFKKITDQVGLGLTPIDTSSIFNVDFNRFNGLLRNLGDDIKTPDFKFLDPTKLLSQANKNLDIWKQGIADKFTTDIGPFLERSIEGALSGIGEALGNALANGGNVIEAVGMSLLSSLGKVLVQLGEMAIGVGITIGAIKKALQSLNPVVAIAAGVALIALGTVVGSAAKGLGNSMGSGGSSNASVAVPRGFQASAPSGFSGSSAQSQLIPTTTIKGSDIVIAYNRQTSLNTRQGV